jgi:hypothetical protein
VFTRFPADGWRAFVPMKRKWLKVLMMLMMTVASFGGPMNPKEIEDLIHIMNETRIEFTIPDEDYKGEGDPQGPSNGPSGRNN